MVIDAYTDPEVPPLPPHITVTQARKYVRSMLEGDPGWRDMIRQTFRDTIEAYLPGKK